MQSEEKRINYRNHKKRKQCNEGSKEKKAAIEAENMLEQFNNAENTVDQASQS